MKKLLIIVFIGMLLTFQFEKVNAQNQKVYDFVSVHTQPTFPGGVNNFNRYLISNIRYPEQARKSKTNGKVFLSFLVEKNGQLTDIKVLRSLGKGTDEEAVRVLKASPKWNPGILNGKPVRTLYNIAVTFNLKKNS